MFGDRSVSAFVVGDEVAVCSVDMVKSLNPINYTETRRNVVFSETGLV